MQFQTEAYRVAEHFVCAIINGDNTALEDDELDQLDDFIDDVTSGKRLGHFSVEPQEAEFALCDICGLGAMCVTVFYHFRELAKGQMDS